MEEFEIKFLEVDVLELERKLLNIGAQKVGEYDYSRALFDYPDFRMNKADAWIRLRTNGEESTLTYKQSIKPENFKEGMNDLGMKEIEVVVSDYQKTYEIFKSMGFVIKREEKNRRVRYQKDDVVYDIDFWPQIPTYLEIESSSLEKAEEAAIELGLNPKEALICGADAVYRRYGINKDEYSYISFDKFVKK